MNTRSRSLLVVSAALLASCAMSPGGSDRIPAYDLAAVADPARPAADTARDPNRKPAATLAFTGLKPGQKVAELLPSTGYFTRLLSAAVGPSGTVYAIAPPPRPNAPAGAPNMAAAVQAIAADSHYANVKVLVEPLATPSVPEPVDLFWTSQNYHDMHNMAGDIGAFNRAVFAALKPGGVYIVLDHAAEAGSGARDTSTLHRIDPEVVKSEVLAAGFRFDGESRILSNANDPHTAKVFDPAIRGKTDQFIFRFRKPR